MHFIEEEVQKAIKITKALFGNNDALVQLSSTLIPASCTFTVSAVTQKKNWNTCFKEHLLPILSEITTHLALK